MGNGYNCGGFTRVHYGWRLYLNPKKIPGINYSAVPGTQDLPVPRKPYTPPAVATKKILKKINRKLGQDWDMEQLKEKIQQWQADPVLFFEEVIGVGRCDCGCKISNQQKRIARDVAKLIRVKEKLWTKQKLTPSEEEFRDKIGISVKAGKGTGKTALVAMLYIWFLICFGNRQKHLVTAPRKEALKDNLFAEISIWITHSKNVYGENSLVDRMIGLESTKLFLKYVYDNKGNLDKEAIGKQGVVLGRTCSRNADEATQQGTLQGYHDVYQMLCADEAFAVPNPVFEPLETTCTREVNFLFLIGNPTRNSGFMYDTFNKNKRWWINHTMNAEESDLVSKDHIQRLKVKYKDYPNMYRVNVQGEFPVDGDGQLIPFCKIMDAVDRFKDLSDKDPRVDGKPVFMGSDIGAGVDPSVCYTRKGIKVQRSGGRCMMSDTRAIARWIAEQIELEEPTKVGLDGITWGKGVLDSLRESGYGDIVSFVDARRRSSDKKRFKNLRAELHFRMAEAFIQDNIAIPDDDELISQLSVLRTVENGETIQIMSKKTMRAEGIDSPNDTDAISFTYYFIDQRFERPVDEDSDWRWNREERPRTTWMAA